MKSTSTAATRDINHSRRTDNDQHLILMAFLFVYSFFSPPQRIRYMSVVSLYGYSVVAVFFNLSDVFCSLAAIHGFNVVDFINFIIMNSELISTECVFSQMENIILSALYETYSNCCELYFVAAVIIASTATATAAATGTTLNRLFNVRSNF